ncbi:hypothetical protein F5B19DRAFT_201282 [Rostrohypoxylon terebratum]|nr:hypothetical protein F5B19DRAFT_201282 [Rostrohypoxylon terebratum]
MPRKDENPSNVNHPRRSPSPSDRRRGKRKHQFLYTRPKKRAAHSRPTPDESESIQLIKQPETRPISQEQLIAEVKGIYNRLQMAERSVSRPLKPSQRKMV